MNRRDFLKRMMVGAAITASGLVIPAAIERAPSYRAVWRDGKIVIEVDNPTDDEISVNVMISRISDTQHAWVANDSSNYDRIHRGVLDGFVAYS